MEYTVPPYYTQYIGQRDEWFKLLDWFNETYPGVNDDFIIRHVYDVLHVMDAGDFDDEEMTLIFPAGTELELSTMIDEAGVDIK